MAKRAQPQEKQVFRACDTPGCEEHAEHRAPKTRQERTDYFLFCLDCVREYNKKWDYFAGMTEEEIEDFRKNAPFGHRPTWEMHITPQQATEQLRMKLNAIFGDGFVRRPEPKSSIPHNMRKALEILEVDNFPTTVATVKSQYKKLVKRYHPDLNQNDPACEERFKQVTEAYSVLMHQLEQDRPHAQ